jgi:hypothetical protein
MRLSRLTFILLLASCTGTQTPNPLPTLQPLSIAMTPAVGPLQGAVHRCAVTQPEVALVLSELPPANLEKAKADLALRFGEPSKITGYATSVAWDKIAIIVHPDNPLRGFDQSRLRELFTGQVYNWAVVGGPERAVQVWTFPENDDARQVFDRAIMTSGSLSSEAMLASDPAQMIREIAGNPGAIGYVPGAWLTDQVRALELAPDLRTALRQPVLALAAAEPQGVVRRFLSCLQSGAGQEELRKIYQP